MSFASSSAVAGGFDPLPDGFSLSAVTSTVSVVRQVFFIQDSCEQRKTAGAA
jgi:hypothetical protein